MKAAICLFLISLIYSAALAQTPPAKPAEVDNTRSSPKAVPTMPAPTFIKPESTPWNEQPKSAPYRICGPDQTPSIDKCVKQGPLPVPSIRGHKDEPTN